MKRKIKRKTRKKKKSVPSYAKGGKFTNSAGEGSISNTMETVGGFASAIPGIGPMIGGAFSGASALTGLLDPSEARIAKSKNRSAKVSMNHPNGAIPTLNNGGFLKGGNNPSHAAGGGKIDAMGNPAAPGTEVAEIEKNEPVKNGFAFSPNLIDPVTGKTYASAANSSERKLKGRLKDGDTIAKRTMKKTEARLMKSNEAQKARIEEQKAQALSMMAQEMQGQLAYGGTFGDPPESKPLIKHLMLEADDKLTFKDPKAKEIDGGYIAPESTKGLGTIKKLPDGTIIHTSDTNKRLANGGPIGEYAFQGSTFMNPSAPLKMPGYDQAPFVNHNASYDEFANLPQYGGDVKKVQQAIKDYQTKSGDTSYDFGGVDGVLGDKTKGFFADPSRNNALMSNLGYSYQPQDNSNNIKGGFYSPDASRNLVRTTDQQFPKVNTSNTQFKVPGIEAADMDVMNENDRIMKSLTDSQPDITNRVSQLLSGEPEGNLINKSGKTVTDDTIDITNPGTAREQRRAKRQGKQAERQAKRKEGADKFKQGMKDVMSGKYDKQIGMGLVGTQLAGQLIGALRPVDQVPLFLNPNAAEAERASRSTGLSFANARNTNLENLKTKIGNTDNVRSNAVKRAMESAAVSDATSANSDIAFKEAQVRQTQNNQTAQLLNSLGAQEATARKTQEIDQSKTNAKKTEEFQALLGSTGNLGKKLMNDSTQRKENDFKLKMIGQQFKNFKLAPQTTSQLSAMLAEPEKYNYSDFITFGQQNGIPKKKLKKMAAKAGLKVNY